jgi:alpha-beta hydrolase superfamily lysophospholipase
MPAVNEFSFPSSNGQDTVRAWSMRPETPKAVLLIAHGMAEYSDRYLPFASFMCENGVAVYANDLLGHGKSFSAEQNKGYFSKKNGWRALVDDMEALRKIAAAENPGLPVFYLGHSMGSFLLRSYLFTYPDKLDGAILSGTAHNPKAVAALGKVIAKTQKLFKGELYRSKLIDSMCFGPYRKPFKPQKTSFDWLSREEENVNKYCGDDLCGFIFTLSAYTDLFNGLFEIATPGNIKRGNPNLPVLFACGSRDPVGGMTKGVNAVITMFKKAGYTNITQKIYSDARHEILNDFCAKDVCKDMLDWLRSTAASKCG